MTSEERMRKACDILKEFRREATMGEAMNRIESEIIAPAIEAEREACAMVADAWVWPDQSDKPDSNLASHVASKIARKIRARADPR